MILLDDRIVHESRVFINDVEFLSTTTFRRSLVRPFQIKLGALALAIDEPTFRLGIE